MILLDSNVLLYATGGQHPLRDPCRDIVTAVADGLVGYLIDPVIAEFVHIRARRTDRASATQLARDFIDASSGVLELTAQTRARALSLYASTSRISSNDALIAAVAIEERLTLISADQDFLEVPGLALAAPNSTHATSLLK